MLCAVGVRPENHLYDRFWSSSPGDSDTLYSPFLSPLSLSLSPPPPHHTLYLFLLSISIHQEKLGENVEGIGHVTEYFERLRKKKLRE